uniref:CSON001500 protein n=1 Tax=Culicoides sonorensis TaxID=179676 RepID=A0A336LQX8_CULSO
MGKDTLTFKINKARNRSKSICVEQPSKFEDPELDIDDENGSLSESYDAVLSDTQVKPDDITEQVIEKVLASLPNNDTSGYVKTLKKIKWNEIKIGNRSEKEIQEIFNKAIKDVNKTRTLTEILNDAKKRMESFEQHPDHPKRPKSLFAMYVQDRFQQIRAENPNIETNEIMGKCSEEFKSLSEKKRQKLENRYAAALEEYNEQMSKFQLRHPDLHKPDKKSRGTPKMTSPFAYYWAERSKELEKPDIKAYSDARKEYAELGIMEKVKYIRQYFQETDEAALSKPERKAYLEARGAPQKPVSAYAAFFQSHLEEYKHLNSTDRMKRIAEKWNKLDKETKNKYTSEANIEMELYNIKWKNFLKTLTKEELKWIELPNPQSKRKKDSDSEDNVNKKKSKVTKPSSSSIPEPVKPPEDVIAYFASKKCDGDKKAAKKKWKSLKDSKKSKYERQLEELQTTYFAELKEYLKSLSHEEVKAYKKRMKQNVKTEEEDDDSESDSD